MKTSFQTRRGVDCGCRSGRRGFTLIELMVASTVTILMIGFLAVIVSNITGSMNRTGGRIFRDGDVSMALDQLALDLEGLVLPVFPGTEALKVTPETVEDADAGWLTFLSATTDPDSPDANGVTHEGAARAVSYRVAYQNLVDGGTDDARYGLFRKVHDSRTTFDDFLSAADPRGTNLWTDAETTELSSFLAGNIVGFSLRFFRNDTEQWTPPGAEIRVGEDGSSVDGVAVPGGFSRVEIIITVLTPEGADRLAQGLDFAKIRDETGMRTLRRTAYFFTPQ